VIYRIPVSRLALISSTTNGSYLSFFLFGMEQSLTSECALFSNDKNETTAFPISAPEDLLNVLEDKRTIFYIFGYLENPEVENVQLIMRGIIIRATDKRSSHVDKSRNTKDYWQLIINFFTFLSALLRENGQCCVA